MTNREIAKKLGISPAALSLIINHKPGVSEDTRMRVLSELQTMGVGYLIKTTPPVQSDNLCFIIYKRHGEILDSHPFFLLLMEYIEAQARTYGYNILLSTIDKRKDVFPQINAINQMNCRGAIIFATEMLDDDMDAFTTLHFPFVAMDNDFTKLNCNTIAINNQMGTSQAIDHLVDAGLKRIGYLKATIRISSFTERQQGYENALRSYGLEFLPGDILDVHYSEEGSYRDIHNYLTQHAGEPIADAFVCDDDTIATGAIRAFTEAGYRIPEDISIIGFNDRPNCEVTIPPLTTINVSKHALAIEAVDEIMRIIEHSEQNFQESRSRKIRIGTKLIKRKSVKNQ